MDYAMNKKYRLLIVDDHALLRAGLWALLAREPDLEGSANRTTPGCSGLAGSLSPDLVLMDITMPRTNASRPSQPETRIRRSACGADHPQYARVHQESLTRDRRLHPQGAARRTAPGGADGATGKIF